MSFSWVLGSLRKSIQGNNASGYFGHLLQLFAPLLRIKIDCLTTGKRFDKQAGFYNGIIEMRTISSK